MSKDIVQVGPLQRGRIKASPILKCTTDVRLLYTIFKGPDASNLPFEQPGFEFVVHYRQPKLRRLHPGRIREIGFAVLKVSGSRLKLMPSPLGHFVGLEGCNARMSQVILAALSCDLNGGDICMTSFGRKDRTRRIVSRMASTPNVSSQPSVWVSQSPVRFATSRDRYFAERFRGIRYNFHCKPLRADARSSVATRPRTLIVATGWAYAKVSPPSQNRHQRDSAIYSHDDSLSGYAAHCTHCLRRCGTEMRSRQVASGARCRQRVSSSCLLLGFHVNAQVAALQSFVKTFVRTHSLRRISRASTGIEAHLVFFGS